MAFCQPGLDGFTLVGVAVAADDWIGHHLLSDRAEPLVGNLFALHLIMVWVLSHSRQFVHFLVKSDDRQKFCAA